MSNSRSSLTKQGLPSRVLSNPSLMESVLSTLMDAISPATGRNFAVPISFAPPVGFLMVNLSLVTFKIHSQQSELVVTYNITCSTVSPKKRRVWP